MTELPIENILLQMIDFVERLNIPYMVMGGFAVRTWGIPRPTYDADLALAADFETLLKLFDLLDGQGYEIPEEHRTGWYDRVGGMDKIKVTRFEEMSVWDIDLFLVGDPLLKSAMPRRRSATLAGRTIYVASPEDLILLKLIAFRRKDQLDIEEILKVCGEVDRTYLDNWASRLGVVDRLKEFD